MWDHYTLKWFESVVGLYLGVEQLLQLIFLAVVAVFVNF
jgi:hypothetical protein